MRYGFYLPTRSATATPDAIETLVARGEALGFASVVIADHLVFPVHIASRYPYTVSGEFPGDGDALDQLSLMAFVAGKTRALRLITSVMILPHRNPVVTAKMLATIDVLSRGRVTVGVGVGWLREEFEALGAPDFDQRGAVSDEYIRIFKTLWTTTPAGVDRRPFSGTPAQIADDIGAYERLGVSELIFDFRSESLQGSLDRMERFATTIKV